MRETEAEMFVYNLCMDIEREEDVRILFCVESGSRAWGLESKNSDYDVRFVFVRSIDNYLLLDKPADIISRHYDKEGKPCKQEGCFYDVSGFDIYKYCDLIKRSNPTVIEWLKSPILYYGQKPTDLISLLEHCKRIALYHHYKSMCRNNYLKYIKGTPTTYKRYLYAMRGLLNAKYVSINQEIPPILLKDTICALQGKIGSETSKKISLIIDLKKKGAEKEIVEHIPMLDEAIESFLKSDEDAPKDIVDKEMLPALNRYILQEVK